jgi:hypothetical protein
VSGIVFKAFFNCWQHRKLTFLKRTDSLLSSVLDITARDWSETLKKPRPSISTLSPSRKRSVTKSVISCKAPAMSASE